MSRELSATLPLVFLMVKASRDAAAAVLMYIPPPIPLPGPEVLRVGSPPGPPWAMLDVIVEPRAR